MAKDSQHTNGVVDLSAKDGVARIEEASPLTRLHYFDGKFLRADAFAKEQDYHRARTRFANLAGGWGAVHGLGIGLEGNRLDVGAGMAITAAGNFVLAVGDLQADLAELLSVAAPGSASGNDHFGLCAEPAKAAVKETPGLAIYEITVGPVEGLCGSEAVYGKLCESACVSSSQHPYWREGVVLRLRPISLQLPASSAVTFGSVHLRNRVSSAYFAAEPWLTPPALGASGLASEIWCNPASLYGRDEVVLGLLVRDGGVNRVIDAWSGRRERLDSQARGYWQGRMAMRPWNVFVAQILQFQCQLSGTFEAGGGKIKPADDCEDLRQLLDKTRQEIDALHRKYAESTEKLLRQFGEKAAKKDTQAAAGMFKANYADLYELSNKLAKADLGQGALPANRMLLNAGFVELPPAGYLPAAPGKQSLEEQMGRIFGEGVKLQFHAVRHDEIGHLVEEAQHLERISLTRGLDDPARIEHVQIFVPDGQVQGVAAAASGEWWQVEMDPEALESIDLGTMQRDDQSLDNLNEAARKAVAEAQAKAMEEARKPAPAPAPAPAAAAAAEPAPAAAQIETNVSRALPSLEEAVKRVDLLRKALAKRLFRGIARTEGRSDGSYGFTLVCRHDSQDILGELRELRSGYAELQEKESQRRIPTFPTQYAVYLAGDIAADPFAVAVGASVSFSGETYMSAEEPGDVAGKLVVLFDRPGTSGGNERGFMLDFAFIDPEGKTFRRRGQISLYRKGDAGDGEFLLDDLKHDPKSAPNLVEWQELPRRAAMYQLIAGLEQDAAIKKGTDTKAGIAEGQAFTNASSVLSEFVDPGLLRRPLLKLEGLAGMPVVNSALGAAALNTLIHIADVLNDPGFLARARRRLFPTADAAPAETVRPVLDWVMFRRARTNLCCPVLPATAVKPTVEAFQVWHVLVADAEQRKALQEALDTGDAKRLATFKLQRVGVLRYREENTVAEESEALIEGLWRAVAPGPQVELARYWEQTPTSGQGWQNHFRLRSMLEQISEITKPPLRGDGAITRLDQIVPPLADGAMDGGFLVVTRSAKVVLKPHRVLMLPFTYYENLKPAFDKNPADAWVRLGEIIARDTTATADLSLDFDAASTMAADSLAKLQQADVKMMSPRTDFGYQLWFRRIDASQVDAGTNPEVRHKAVMGNIGKAKTVVDRFDEGVTSLGITDLGAGAQSATVVFYASVVEIG